MEEKNKHIRYYILFDNHTQGMMLHELLDKQGLPNRIAPAPRDTDGKAACGMALLIHPDDIDAVRTCIEENHAEYVNIVPLESTYLLYRDFFYQMHFFSFVYKNIINMHRNLDSSYIFCVQNCSS